MTNHNCSCGDLKQAMYALLDRELSEAECARLEAHLRECPACSTYRDNEQQLRHLLKQCCCGPAPESLKQRISYSIRVTTVETRRQ